MPLWSISSVSSIRGGAGILSYRVSDLLAEDFPEPYLHHLQAGGDHL